MNKLQYLIQFLIFIGTLVVFDSSILYFFFKNEQELFHFENYKIITLFTSLSFIVCATSYYFYKKNFDIVGYVFLFLTMVKMISLLFISKTLLSSNTILDFEKYHFFVLFFLFLMVETYLTILLLNKKQK
jgi:hypothetical protein